MNIQNQDKTYHGLSTELYKIKKSNKKVNIKINGSNQNFKIMASRFDHENGFQAMAVSSINGEGKVDKNEMDFAYAGTQLMKDENADIGTDIQLVIANAMPMQIDYPVKDVRKYGDLGTKEIHKRYTGRDTKMPTHLSQFDEAAIWTKAVIAKYQPKHKYGTGHSLGGGNALPMGVLFDFDQVRTFSAPNTFSLLPPEIQKDFNNYKYKDRFIDYVHDTDMIGNARFGKPIIGSERVIIGKRDSASLIKGHALETFLFAGENIAIKLNYEALYSISNSIYEEIHFLEKAINSFNYYIDETKREAKAIENKYTENILSGGYEFIGRGDIENYMSELSKIGRYDFYDDTAFEDIQQKMHEIKRSSERFAVQLRDKTQKMQDVEIELSGNFGLN